MSQEYFSPKGKSLTGNGGEGESSRANDVSSANRPSFESQESQRPDYMTVGNGSESQHVARLQSMLNQDSGYGGSITSEDAPFPGPNATAAWDIAGQPDWHAQPSAVHQLWYNQHRAALGRAISHVIKILQGLQGMNATWPAHYPSVQRADNANPQSTLGSRPTLHHTNSMSGDYGASSAGSLPPALRRSLTSLEDLGAESSRAAERKVAAEPRLVTPQIAREFSILKLDLKLGALHQAELVHSLEKGSIASLLDGKISSSVKHLQSLRERIEDTSSKVLVTGDLNSGKSTFCNALLRRKILPEDQQPCTSIFCEVLDARENRGVEEVHAIRKDVMYDRNDESTYDVFSIHELEKLVTDNSTYMQCKVYIKDGRTIDESLLNNGVVDIALIDAPGLNSDTTKTTAIFARQEEIDVVVFVVSAANHFTQTAKDFIYTAAAEKAYLFIVVNGYDTIRDKDRCSKMILDQVSKLSPATRKEASELVHFVSSNAIPMVIGPSGGPGGPGGTGSASSIGGAGDDEPGDDDPKGKGKEKEKIRDFGNLEQSLRRFVLEKRARSKLAPAKTYLLNILNDVNVLATVNEEVAQTELSRVRRDLEALEPMLEQSKKARTEISDQINLSIEATCEDIYNHSRGTINAAITRSGEENLEIAYPGLFGAFQYADDLKEAMLSQIAASVSDAEEYAREKTVGGVNLIKQLGILHLGNEYGDVNFRADIMFRRKRDTLARQVDIPTEFWDFVDWSTVLQKEEKTGMALTVAGVIGTGVVGGLSQVKLAFRAAQMMGSDHMRRMILPGLVIATVAAAYYVLNQIPRSLPHRLHVKVAAQLQAIDYVHSNSSRIAGSVRKVLTYPANSLRVGLQRSVEQLSSQRDKTLRVRNESELALKYFSNLVRDTTHQRTNVQNIDLDGHPPNAIGLQ